MDAVVDAAVFRVRLDEFLERIQRGERIVVRREDGSQVILRAADEPNLPAGGRQRIDRTVAQVLAEDRGCGPPPDASSPPGD